MASDNNLRRRTTQNATTKNGYIKRDEKKIVAAEFQPRESPLTILFETSPHIRALYHIFIVILMLLFFDTVIHDFVERGKINLGLSIIASGFGDVGRAIRLWLFLLVMVLTFYPGLRLYAYGSRHLTRHPALSRAWTVLGVAGLVALQTALLAVPIRNLARQHLAIASSVTVTLEMLRFVMKVHSLAVECTSAGVSLPSFSHFLYFLFAPTLLYRDHYPRTKKIRWRIVTFHLMEVVAIIFYNSFLWERFILPYWSDYGKETRVEVGRIARGIFAGVLPGVLSFLCGFYCLLHAWLNAFAEMLTFADRLFYEEWWTTSQFSRYYRAWNRVVHVWLRNYIHRPLAPHTGRVCATLAVFFISAVAHELVLTLSFGFFYPVLLIEFGVFGLLFMPLTDASGRRFPSALNLFMWFGLLFGNGILWSLYSMEHFARKNCLPSENDSFFVPKSWSCPEVVLKSNWTFHNPFLFID